MKPDFYTVTENTRETHDVVTIRMAARNAAHQQVLFEPGQFNMLYAFGVGEVAISISGDPAQSNQWIHTIRSVGPVSRALTELQPGQAVGVRGPFGTPWPMASASGKDVLIIAGGLGLAPVRPAVHYVLNHRADFGEAALLVGARTPDDLPYRQQLQAWRREPGLQLRVTVDRASTDWVGDVGLVTAQLDQVRFDPSETIALICGPEIMIRMTALKLQDMGVEADDIYVSLERNMQCAIGLCGHCQFGPHFVCRDGPVFPFSRVGPMMTQREL